MLLHLLCICIFPLTIGVLCVEVVFRLWGDEGGGPFFCEEFVPVVVFEPHVLLDFFWSIETQSACGLALDEFVDEISSLTTPTLRNFLLFYLDLFRKDVVSNFLAVFSLIGTFAKHAFVGNNTHRKVVHSNAVILSTHNFGSHVARSATGVLGVLRVPNSGNTQVSNSQVAVLVENQVFRLNVSMEDAVLVQVFETQ